VVLPLPDGAENTINFPLLIVLFFHFHSGG
jgi:hypothetical protein